MRNQNYLNITSYITILEEFSYYWCYRLIGNVVDSLNYILGRARHSKQKKRDQDKESLWRAKEKKMKT